MRDNYEEGGEGSDSGSNKVQVNSNQIQLNNHNNLLIGNNNNRQNNYFGAGGNANNNNFNVRG